MKMIDATMCEDCLLSKLSWLRSPSPYHHQRTQYKNNTGISGMQLIWGGTDNTVYEAAQLVLDRVKHEQEGSRTYYATTKEGIWRVFQGGKK